MYHPTREIVNTPESIGLDYNDINLKVSGGLNIHGWHIPSNYARGAVLFLHGNGGNISNSVRLETIKLLHKLNMDVVIIDYEGYGKSDGKPGEDETYRDAEAAWTWLTKEQNITPDKIVIYGRSLGGAIAIDLASKHRHAGLVIESSFTSAGDMAKKFLWWLPFARNICIYDYNSLEKISKCNSPKLFAHSPNDTLIPYAQGRRLFEAASEPKTFFEMQGGHNDSFYSTPGYAHEIARFLNAIFPE